jgi:acetoacetate decarboxylase
MLAHSLAVVITKIITTASKTTLRQVVPFVISITHPLVSVMRVSNSHTFPDFTNY